MEYPLLLNLDFSIFAMLEKEDYDVAFEPSEGLDDDFFYSVRKFEGKYDSKLHHLFHMIVKASEKGMWYDIDHDQLFTSSEYNWMLKNGRISHYSKNPSYPIFGRVKDYVDRKGPKVAKYAEDLRILGTGIVTNLDTDRGKETLKLLAKELSSLSADLIHNLKYSHQKMAEYYKNPQFWYSLISFEQKRRGLPISKPVSYDLEPIYHGMRRSERNVIVREHISKQTKPEGYAIYVAEMHGLVDGDEVILLSEKEENEGISEEEMYRFRIFRSKEGIKLERPDHE